MTALPVFRTVVRVDTLLITPRIRVCNLPFPTQQLVGSPKGHLSSHPVRSLFLTSFGCPGCLICLLDSSSGSWGLLPSLRGQISRYEAGRLPGGSGMIRTLFRRQVLREPSCYQDNLMVIQDQCLLQALGWGAIFQLSLIFLFKEKNKSKLSSPVLPRIHFLLGVGVGVLPRLGCPLSTE